MNSLISFSERVVFYADLCSAYALLLVVMLLSSVGWSGLVFRTSVASILFRALVVFRLLYIDFML